jgi:hypothetical protein
MWYLNYCLAISICSRQPPIREGGTMKSLFRWQPSRFNFPMEVPNWIWQTVLVTILAIPVTAQEAQWKRFAIDDTLHGADGVRLQDVNGDGRLDIATGWEQSGVTKIYLHPGFQRVTDLWPSVVAGAAPAVEDAVWVDTNGDGRLDVISSCEGKDMSLRLHLAPRALEDLLKAESWRSEIIPASKELTRWMYALPLSLSVHQPPDQSRATDLSWLVLGSKQPNAMVALMHMHPQQSPEDWKIIKLTDASWIMSLESRDIDRDGDSDIIYSDRKGSTSGVYWLENPGKEDAPWDRHAIGALGEEVMFLQVLSVASDGANQRNGELEIVAAVKPLTILRLKLESDCRRPWAEQRLEVGPADRLGDAKSVAMADIQGDGRLEMVFSCESAKSERSGVVYLSQDSPNGEWALHDISGPVGIKYDRLELIDLDGDRDLDVLTCEESANSGGLGVIWYQNPFRS